MGYTQAFDSLMCFKYRNNVRLSSVCLFLRTVKLIFFNKKEDDILWRNQLEQLALTDERYLQLL